MTIPDPRRAPVTVRLTDTEPRCPRCGAAALLTAQVPHGWANPDGRQTSGSITVILCPSCDAAKPAAGALITYFHVYSRVDAGTVGECASLIQAWVDTLTIPPVDTTQLEAEIQAWYRGEL